MYGVSKSIPLLTFIDGAHLIHVHLARSKRGCGWLLSHSSHRCLCLIAVAMESTCIFVGNLGLKGL